MLCSTNVKPQDYNPNSFSLRHIIKLHNNHSEIQLVKGSNSNSIRGRSIKILTHDQHHSYKHQEIYSTNSSRDMCAAKILYTLYSNLTCQGK